MKNKDAIKFLRETQGQIEKDLGGRGLPEAHTMILTKELQAILEIPIQVLDGKFDGTPEDAAILVVAAYATHEALGAILGGIDG